MHLYSKQQLFAFLIALLLTFTACYQACYAEEFDFENDCWDDTYIIMDEPDLFMSEEEDGYCDDLFIIDEDEIPHEEPTSHSVIDLLVSPASAESAIPVITSIGKKNVKLHGIRSDNQLLEYTIPEELLAADPNFLALMVEAEKYIGFPYVYGQSNPDTGFDCSGFVSWVYIKSGVYDTKRRGANGLYSLCEEVPPEKARPGDLVFFEKTMGPNVEGITHVGIYVGNNMMIHAGDPVGFADLSTEKWQDRFYCFGRLPF